MQGGSFWFLFCFLISRPSFLVLIYFLLYFCGSAAVVVEFGPNVPLLIGPVCYCLVFPFLLVGPNVFSPCVNLFLLLSLNLFLLGLWDLSFSFLFFFTLFDSSFLFLGFFSAVFLHTLFFKRKHLFNTPNLTEQTSPPWAQQEPTLQKETMSFTT